MVCDQPFLSSALIEKLVSEYRHSGKPIIAASYENNAGTPALFDQTIFSKLMELKGDIGAKKIIKENPGEVSTVDFPLGSIDIDTAADYERLLDRNLSS